VADERYGRYEEHGTPNIRLSHVARSSRGRVARGGEGEGVTKLVDVELRRGFEEDEVELVGLTH
jgi:hypothetical protein